MSHKRKDKDKLFKFIRTGIVQCKHCLITIADNNDIKARHLRFCPSIGRPRRR